MAIINRRDFMKLGAGAGLGVSGLARSVMAQASSVGDAAPTGDILRYRASNQTDKRGLRYAYFAFAAPDYTIQADDHLEYDLFIQGTSPRIAGGIDFTFTDGGSLRESGTRDQNRKSSHPATELSDFARDRWYHRRIDLTPCAGRTIKECEIGISSQTEKLGEYLLFFGNAVITNRNNIARELYTQGEPERCHPTKISNLQEVSLCRIRVEEMGLAECPTSRPEIRVSNQQTLTDKAEDFVDAPALASNGAEAAWVIWLSRLKDGRERIMVKEHHGQWAPALSVTEEAGYFETPRIDCAKGGQPMIVWTANEGEHWRIDSTLYDGCHFSPAVTATPEAGRATNPTLLALPDGTYWLAWEHYQNGHFRIGLKRFAEQRWGKMIEVTAGEDNTYEPALAVDPKGVVWIAYSRAEGGEKNIYLKSYDPQGNRLGEAIPISLGGTESYLSGHPYIVADAQGRIWIAWERIAAKPSPQFFGNMECQVACYDQDRLQAVQPTGRGYRGKNILIGDDHHLPALRYDEAGRLWLFSRKSNPERRAWSMTASLLEGKHGWTAPVELIEPQPRGRCAPTAIASDGAGSLWIAWQADNVLSNDIWPAQGASNVRNLFSCLHVARVELPPAQESLGPPTLITTSPGERAKRPFGRPRPQRREIKRGGDTYTLLFGNLHEHTNISRCALRGDGELHENMRFGLDVEKYDFVALTDHGYDLYEVAWRKTRRVARFYNDGPHFVALPAYEWTLSSPKKPPGSGHRNVIFSSDAEAAQFICERANNVYHCHMPESNLPDKVWQLLRDKKIKAVTIPHHTVDQVHPMDWDYHDPEYQCVVEIFQARQSCEHAGCPREQPRRTELPGGYVQDALARGYKMGFIASGDHNHMGLGLAALLVKEVSQEGVIEALRARRCYATTGDKIFIDFRINEAIMGEEIAVASRPHIQATIEAAAPLTSIVLFRDGRIIHELKADQLGGRKDYTIDLTDEEFDGSKTNYYYVRALQDNNEIVWSSPIWVSRV